MIVEVRHLLSPITGLCVYTIHTHACTHTQIHTHTHIYIYIYIYINGKSTYLHDKKGLIFIQNILL